MEWIKIFDDEQHAKDHLRSGNPQLVIIGHRRICLVWHNHRFFAVQDRCPHNGESLSKGRVNHLGEIVCPWHHYRFRLASGQACDSSCADLKVYPTRADETGFYIAIY